MEKSEVIGKSSNIARHVGSGSARFTSVSLVPSALITSAKPGGKRATWIAWCAPTHFGVAGWTGLFKV